MWSQSQCLDLDVLSRHIKILVSWSCLGQIDVHFGVGIEVLDLSIGLTQLGLVHIHSSSSSSSSGGSSSGGGSSGNSLSDDCVSCTMLNNFKSRVRLHWDWKPDSIGNPICIEECGRPPPLQPRALGQPVRQASAFMHERGRASPQIVNSEYKGTELNKNKVCTSLHSVGCEVK